jgi:uncharacterized protein (TIGR02246 family)
VGLAAVVASVAAAPVRAQDAANSPSGAAHSADEAAIRASAAAFVAAFKRQDAPAVAQLWTENGEYVDEAGQAFQGRKAVEQLYATFFRDHPGSEIQVSVDSIRLINATAAIEDGRAVVTPRPAGAAAGSKYVAIHAKQADGKWRLASVRESRIDAPAIGDPLQHLELLVGDWTAEHAGTRADLSGRWNENKSFLERRFVVTRDGDVVSSSLEIIVWDPATKQVTSWTFSSDGGRATGVWTALEDGWAIQSAGIAANGTSTAAIDVWAPLHDGALGWRSTRRSVGGRPVSDSKHVVLTKKKPADAVEE